MKTLTVWRTNWRRTAPWVVLALVAGVIAVGAFEYKGYSRADVHLNDGTVWVTKKSDLMVGRLGRDIQQLTGGVHSGSSDFDIYQDADNVLVHDQSAGTLSVVDLAYVTLGQPVTIPAGAQVSLGAGHVGILDPQTGKLWVRSVAALPALDIKKQAPDAELGGHAELATSPDGTVFALDLTNGEVTSAQVGPSGTPEGVHTKKLKGAMPKDPADAQFSVVGDKPVLLNRKTGTIQTTGHDPISLGSAGKTPAAQLQMPGADSDAAAVSIDGAALQVDLGSGKVRRTPVANATGAIRPVVVSGCTHSAWGTSATYAMQCPGAKVVTATIPQLDTGDNDLVFRVNRDIVVLNDALDGNSWLVQSNMKLVTNWSNVTPPDDSDKQNKNGAKKNQIDTVASRTQKNRPPVAVDDDLGARPGQETILPVVLNDTDPDGDIVTITNIHPTGHSDVTLSPVLDSTAVQAKVPANGPPSFDFSYTISDGRGGTDTANVHVRVVPMSENHPPKQVRPNDVTTALGGQVKSYVLGTWVDPDGDDLVLQDASIKTGDTVQGAPDGEVSYIDSGAKPGKKTVQLTVSDGRASTVGQLNVNVQSGGLKPTAVPDHVVTTVGETTHVAPLTNDLSPSSSPLNLSQVAQVPGLTVKPDYVAGTFTVSAAKAGTYYITYQASSNGASSIGFVRLDVTPDEGTNVPPIAVRDHALLPQGGSTLVDLTANDEDANNDVLVVQSIDVPDGSGLDVGIIDQHLVRVSSDRALTGPVSVNYTVSDGRASDDGTLVVTPLPRNPHGQPPVAQPDTATVRAGDIVNMPVLDNDSDPDGDPITLDHQLIEKPASGLLFEDDGELRYQAPDKAGTVRAVYKIHDSTGQSASALVTIYVIPKDNKSNSAPDPQSLEARDIAGSPVRINVPMDGIDPDGDSVKLLGATTGPAKGYVSATGPDWIEYTAYPSAAGPDSFEYAVADRYGLEGTATIRVGVAPRAATNSAPVALNDEMVVRSGRKVAVDVLANDSDIDLDRLSIPPSSVVASKGTVAKLDPTTSRVVFTVPGGKSLSTATYTIEDGHGGSDTGVVTVKGSPTAPLLAPIARDDTVAMDKVTGHAVGAKVKVPVLSNDEDPDGSTADLVVSAYGASKGKLTFKDNVGTVTLAADAQLLTYQERDADGNVSYAFINVPGVDQAAPVLRLDKIPVKVHTGKKLVLNLGDYVVVRDGHKPLLTDEQSISATNSNGADLAVDKDTLAFTSAKGFHGNAAITFEVTDGSSADDPKGITAVLTIPIIVEAGGNEPPSINAGQLQVAAGEPAKELDLSTLATDPNSSDVPQLKYSAGAAGKGVSVQLHGSTLSATATTGARKGTVVKVPVKVTDPSGDSAKSTVTVTVVASSRPLAKAPTYNVEVQQGHSISVDVLKEAFNPFPGKPLTVYAAHGDGSGSVGHSGNTVTVTPGAKFVGTMRATYTLRDATGDEARDVDGTILVVVGGVPDAPAIARVETYSSHTVVLNWTEPADNGAPITRYEVTGTGGVHRTCPATTCTIKGLQNGHQYTFRIAAVNKYGPGPLSPPSAVAKPDQVPDQPNAPVAKFGDGSATVRWTAPHDEGSPLVKYDLTVSPSDNSGNTTVSVPAGQRSYVWKNLSNGTAYTFSVRAWNKSPDPSTYSSPSAPVVPAGKPSAPATPTAQPAGGAIGNQVTVSWNAPNNNGDAISNYVVRVYRNGALNATKTTGGSTTSLTVNAQNASQYTFTVSAVNKAGTGAPSPRSAAVTPYGKPGTIGKPSATSGDGSSKLTFSAPSSNGKAITSYQYSISGGAAKTLASSKTVSGLTNGKSYTFRVRACNGYCGTWSAASNSVTPYGVPTAPSISASASGTTINFSWSATSSANGSKVDKTQYRINGGAWHAVSGSTGKYADKVGKYDTSATIQVEAHNARGWGAAGSKSGKTGSDPTPPTVTVSKGSPYGGNGCNDPSCAHVKITVKHLSPNTTYQYSPRCDYSGCINNSFGQTSAQVYGSLRTDSSGNGSDDQFYYGFQHTHVWAIITQGNIRSNTITWTK